MIGVFDSWLWGMQTLQYLRNLLPTYTFCYLWDTAYVPYGTKSGEWIRERTFQCLERLFAQWCVLVIMACNTASAFALRERQERYPDRKVLSVTVPGVEALVAGWWHHPLLLATKVTIETHIYELVRVRAYPSYQVDRYVQIGHGRVDALEEWAWAEELRSLVQASDLSRFLWNIDCVILGCTHYPLLKELIQSSVPGIALIDPAYASAQQLVSYLARHQFLDSLCKKQWDVVVFVTGDTDSFTKRIQNLRWITYEIQQVII